MSTQLIAFDLILTFFVYGLAFFTMGIAMLLEAGRAPLLAEARVLRPLAAFGLLHGIYEWLILFFIQMRRFELQIPLYVEWLRLILLVVSFISLLAFGVQIFRLPGPLAHLDAYVGIGMLVLYAIILASSHWIFGEHVDWMERSDLLARYILAIPGGLVAAFATYYHSHHVDVENRHALVTSLKLAAWGFGLYAITQVFVLPSNWGLAKILNIETFRDIFGVPIQVVRATLALLITVGLIRATQVVEKERQRRLVEAQQARLEALERVQDELLKQEEIRRELLRYMVVTQEEERARISRELHDETAQTLTAIQINLAALQNRLPISSKANELFTRLQALGDQIARDIHRMVHDLRPAQLDDLGLISALEFLIEEIQQSFDLKIAYQVSGIPERLDSLVETVLYRVAQEALTNVVRHAQTKDAQVELHFLPGEIRLSISDEGIGFNPDSPPQLTGRFGMAGMRERVESVGGDLTIHSVPGQVTQVTVTIPLRIAHSRGQEFRNGYG